jgi:hypothetical protein
MGQRASPGIKEGVCVRNWRTTHRIARATRAGGRPKCGEDDLGSPMKFCRVRELGKLHELPRGRRGLEMSGVGWPRWPRLGLQWRAEESSPELRRGVWPAKVSTG